MPQYSAIYHRIAAKKAKQIAIVAVARRMLEDAWTMLIRDEVFRLMTVTTDVATATTDVTDARSVSTAADEKSAAAVTRPVAG